jgi:hypothetical protein
MAKPKTYLYKVWAYVERIEFDEGDDSPADYQEGRFEPVPIFDTTDPAHLQRWYEDNALDGEPLPKTPDILDDDHWE